MPDSHSQVVSDMAVPIDEPLVSQREAFASEKEPADQTQQFQIAGEIRVLILDDDPATCRLIQAMLGNLGLTIDTLSDPAHAEEWLKSQQYHLIILDYVLPGLKPEQTFQWINERQTEACVIVVTGHATIESALNCLRARVHDYVQKPIQYDQLRASVTRSLEAKGLLRMSEEALRESIGNVIRDRRKAHRMTLETMSRKTGVSLGYLSQIELGKNSASIETLYKICLALGLRMADLFQTVQKAL